MPMIGWVDTGKVYERGKKKGEPITKRTVFCSRDMKCDFNNPSANVVREHELAEHPREHDGEEPKDLPILPQLRRGSI